MSSVAMNSNNCGYSNVPMPPSTNVAPAPLVLPPAISIPVPVVPVVAEDFPHVEMTFGYMTNLRIKNSYLHTMIEKKKCAISTKSEKIYELSRVLQCNSNDRTVFIAYNLQPIEIESDVYERIPNESPVVIKMIRKSDKAYREINAMNHIGNDHQNVMGYIECFESDDNVFCVMQYCSRGDLFSVVKENGKLSEVRAKKYFRDILNGLEYIHDKRVCHRDLSMENVLLGEDDSCVICDYDFAVQMPWNESTNAPSIMSCDGGVGKESYIAPEVIGKELVQIDGIKSDVWQLGVILFCMLANGFPMRKAVDQDPLFRWVVQGRLGDLVSRWGVELSSDALDVLRAIFKRSPADRPTIQQLKEMKWLAI